MKYFTLFLLAFCLISCYQLERNCSDYKTGKFDSEVTINGTLYKSTFYRNDTLKVETYEGKTDSSY